MNDTLARTNRRLLSRHTCHLNVRYRTNGDWHPATAMDASRAGCRLRVGEDLARGSELVVAFVSAANPEASVVEVVGRVIWCRIEGLSFQLGVHFAEAPEQLESVLSGDC